MLSQTKLQVEREEKLAEIRSIGLPDSFADCPADWVGKVCEYVDGPPFGGVEEYLDSCGVTAPQQAEITRILTMVDREGRPKAE